MWRVIGYTSLISIVVGAFLGLVITEVSHDSPSIGLGLTFMLLCFIIIIPFGVVMYKIDLLSENVKTKCCCESCNARKTQEQQEDNDG